MSPFCFSSISTASTGELLSAYPELQLPEDFEEGWIVNKGETMYLKKSQEIWTIVKWDDPCARETIAETISKTIIKIGE